MKTPRWLLIAAGLTALTAVGSASWGADSRPRSPLVLISLDGFRRDYTALHPAETPHLRQLMREGVSAAGLIPVFPSNTFPNHYSIVTGLYPTSHGMVNNHLFDVQRGEAFHYNHRAAVEDGSWWGGEPIWVTAARQGRKSGCLFWVGSEAPIQGLRPTFWRRFDRKLPFGARLAELVAWLTLPADERPEIVTFYLEETNSVGHRFGPESPELIATVKLLDAQLGEIRDRLQGADLDPDFVIVSDHGMTPCGPDRVILLDDFVDLAGVHVDFEASTAGLRPAPGVAIDSLMRDLAKLPVQAKAYRSEDLPARLHIDPRSPRVPPIWILPEEGWQVMRRESFLEAEPHFPKGQHGYDPTLPSMHGILICAGPAFKSTGEVLEPVENVHVYNLLCAALGLEAAPNEGDARLVRAMLR